MTDVRVYRYGCRAPNDERTAIQIIGQAANYREDQRRVVNDDARRRKDVWSANRETAHVAAWAAHHRAVHVEARARHEQHAALREAKLADERAARKARGHLLDWGTYTLVEAEVDQAATATKLDPVRRADFDATGRIGAFILSRDAFPVDDWRHPRVSLTEPDARGHAVLTMRVGPAKSMTVITWPIKIHRPLPRGGTVKQVAVQRIRVGHRYRWEALVTVAFDAGERDRDAGGCVGVDIGWRVMPDGQRVAMAVGSDGHVEELRIDTLAAFEYADAVRGTRDKHFDEAKAHAADAGHAPHARLWRDKERMRSLARRAGDIGLAWWHERDKHLEDIECGVRMRAQRRRLDVFRVFADRLAKRYRIAAMEDMPMGDFVGEAETHAKERKRSTAALYMLQQTILHRFGAARVDWVPARDTTRTCSSCGGVRSEGVGSALHWTCADCGVEHDQDENAARVICSIGERWSGAGNPPRARKRKASKGKGKVD